MTRTYFIYIMFVLFCVPTVAQNMQILYDFDHLPQTLLLNPGSKVDYKKHFGVPLLSNLYIDIGSSNENITYNSVIAGSDGLSDMLNKMYALGLSEDDVFSFNQQIELFNMGFQLKNPTYYLSFGMYQQIDGFSAYAPDVANLFANGNDQNGDGVAEINDPFVTDQLNTVGELVGVFHIGINKRFNEKFSAGARLKILSGSLGVETNSNQGDYYLTRNSIDPYVHNYENMNTTFNSSGILDYTNLQDDVGETNELISDLFFLSGSVGMALDFGFTYDLSDEFTVTGSILDLGMLKFNHKLTEIEFQDAQIPSSDFYDPTEGDEIDYWQDQFIEGLLPIETSPSSYNQFRAPKLNASVRYNMRRLVKQEKSAFRNVSANLLNEYLISSLGMQVYTEFRHDKALWAVTGFYSREITRYLNAKVTYTVDRFSATNLGLGFSVNVKSFNFFAAVDNLLALPNVKNSNYQSFQGGMNFIFK